MYTKVLVPLDGSELSLCSLEQVKKVASAGGVGEVILLRVIEPILSNEAAAWAQGGYTVNDVENKNRESAKEYLSLAADTLIKENIPTRVEVVYGFPAESILDYAKRNEVELIIISTHGRSGISRWAFGSVASKVAHYSQIPVLLVTPQDCRSDK